MEIAGLATLTSQVLWCGFIFSMIFGAVFCFGMLLSSDCGSKTPDRIGGGSLKPLVAFAVMGIAAIATVKGITAIARSAVYALISILAGCVAGLKYPIWRVSRSV